MAKELEPWETSCIWFLIRDRIAIAYPGTKEENELV
jgi:hypothetical protein